MLSTKGGLAAVSPALIASMKKEQVRGLSISLNEKTKARARTNPERPGCLEEPIHVSSFGVSECVPRGCKLNHVSDVPGS